MNKMLNKLIILVMSLGILASTLAVAHGPTPQKIAENIIINADVATVWNKVQAFELLAQWHPLVASVDMTDEITRVVTLVSGGEITDSLDVSDAEAHYMSYRLLLENVEVMPVSFYTIGIQVEAADNGSLVSWSVRFYRADTGNFPPENLNDAAAVKAMTEYAKSGLDGLKSALEK